MAIKNLTNIEGDKQLMNAILKELRLSYTQFPLIYAEKFKWQRELWNETDYLGFAQRVCRDVTNMILAEPVDIWTPSELINQIIDEDLYGRLQLNSVLSKNFALCMGIGDMVISTYTDSLDGRPGINYIMGYNVIPISYNNHEVHEIAWFQKEKIKDKVYITMVIEGIDERKTFLYEYDGAELHPIDFGTPLWYRLLGKGIQPTVAFNDKYPHKRFAWISTGLVAPRWQETPFHNSFIWPTTYLNAIKTDYKRLETEFEKSEKFIFLSPELIRRTSNLTDENGFALNVKKADLKGGLFQCVDLSEDKIDEWVPQVRFNEFAAKIKFDLQMFTQAVGLGQEMYSFDYPKIEMNKTQTFLSHKDAFNTINNIKYNLKSGLQTIVYALIQEWYAEGLIPDEEMNKIIGLSDIVVDFDDGIFVNKDERTDLGIRIINSASTIPGMRNIDQYTFLTDYCGYSKQRARDIMNKTLQEFEQSIMVQLSMGGNKPQQ